MALPVSSRRKLWNVEKFHMLKEEEEKEEEERRRRKKKRRKCERVEGIRKRQHGRRKRKNTK